MRAIQEEVRSAYRMQAQRLADLAFAEIKEKLYRNEIPWKQIAQPSQEKTVVLEDVVEVAIEPLGKRKFVRRGTLHSVGKKAQNGDEWRLATFRVEIKPLEKGMKLFQGKKNPRTSKSFIYQVLVGKTSAPAAAPVLPEGAPTGP